MNENYILRKLREIVKFSYLNSKFYRHFYASKNFNSFYLSFKDFEELPILTKDIVIKHREEIITSIPFGAILPTTGSTGNPLLVEVDKNYLRYMGMLKYRQLIYEGYLPTKRLVEFSDSFPPFSFKILSNLSRNKLILLHSSFNSEEIGRLVNLYKPDYLIISPSLFLSIFPYLKKEWLKGKNIILGGENVPRELKEILNEKYKINIYEWYGSTELGFTAFECRHHHLHINSDFLYLEFLNFRGRIKKIIGTNFLNKRMPFIRYDIGDLGIPSSERCIIKLPTIEKIVGRDFNFLYLPPKTIIPQDYLVSLIFKFFKKNKISFFSRFLTIKFYQLKEDRIKVMITKEWNDEEKEKLRKFLNSIFGEKIKIEIKETKKFPTEKMVICSIKRKLLKEIFQI
jgi:phenylacetate-CoA ligase